MNIALSADASSRPAGRLQSPGLAQHRAVKTAARWLKAACVAAVWAPMQALAAAPDVAAFNGLDVANASIAVGAIQRGGPPRDGIPAIDQPKFVSAAAAGLADDDRVLGLALGGMVRAYPVPMRVNKRGELSDTVAGQTLRIRYQPEHGSAEAFEAKGQPLAATMACWFAWVAFYPQTELLGPR